MNKASFLSSFFEILIETAFIVLNYLYWHLKSILIKLD